MLAEADSSGMAFLKPPKFSQVPQMWSNGSQGLTPPTHGQEAEGRQVAATRGMSSGQAGWGRSPATPNTPVLLLLLPHEGHRGLCSPPSQKTQASPTLTRACRVLGWKEGHSAPHLESPGFRGCEGGPWTCSGRPEAFAGLPGWPPAASRPMFTESLDPSSPSSQGPPQSPLQAAENH